MLIRGLWLLFVASVTFCGVLVGHWTGRLLGPRLVGEEAGNALTYFLVGVNVLFGLIGFLVALFAFRKLINWLTHLQDVALLDKAAAAMGVILGLAIALLATAPFAALHYGLPIQIFASIVGIILGIMFAMSANEQLLYVFPGLARLSTGGEAQLPPGTRMLDTNIVIDGRIADIVASGFLDGPIVVPNFILNELRHIADSAENLKRERGRRGLDVLNRLKSTPGADVIIYHDPSPPKEHMEVDARLVSLAARHGATVVTNDYSVQRIASLEGVAVLNVNELAGAMRPTFLPGEELTVTVIKEGKEPGQGVGYLDDGTMVVVEKARSLIGKMIVVAVTSVLQTNAGKMLFAEVKGHAEPKGKE